MKIIIRFTVCIALLVLLTGAAEGKDIRVGCIDIQNFLTVSDSNIATGYAAEYLDKISSYTGWTYTYVKGSWTDCLKWLREGKIDLLMPAERSDDRMNDFLFSKIECCSDYAAMIAMNDNDKLFYEDFESFDDINVGMIYGNYLNNEFDDYEKKHGFHTRRVYYTEMEHMNAALERGVIDAAVTGNMFYYPNQKIIAKMNNMPAYFITSKNRPDIMEELDKALIELQNNNVYFLHELYNKYYKNMNLALSFTRAEKNFIRNSNEYTILFDKNEYPLEWYNEETNSFEGIYVDIARIIERESGLKFKYAAPPSGKNAWDALSDGDADLLGSVYASPAVNMNYNFNFTNPYYNISESIIARRGEDLNLFTPINTAILEMHKGTKNLLADEFPQWNLKTYNSVNDCLKAVNDGVTDIACINALTLQTQSYMNNDNNFIILLTNYLTLPVSIGISSDQPEILKRILDKAITKIDVNEVNKNVLKNTILYKKDLSITEVVSKYPLYIFSVITVISVLALAGMILFRSNKLMARQNRVLEEKNQQLKKAAELEAELRHESEVDALTTLKNKKTGESICVDYIASHSDEHSALMVIDIDNFKYVNDTYGHLFGDEVLKRIGAALFLVSGNNDVAARIGGDEFIVFMKNVKDENVIRNKAEQIAASIERIEKEKLCISCSIGIAININNVRSYEELFELSDKALYAAKKTGKNKYVFYNYLK